MPTVQYLPKQSDVDQVVVENHFKASRNYVKNSLVFSQEPSVKS